MKKAIAHYITNNKLCQFLFAVCCFLALDFLAFEYYATFEASDYVILHTLFELTAIIVAFSVFNTVWIIRDSVDDYSAKFILVFGVFFFSVGAVDIMHVLSYQGMPNFFTVNDSQKATVLWLYGRYLSVIGFLTAVFWPKGAALNMRKSTNVLLLFMLFAISGAFFMATYYLEDMPALYIPDEGLTQLKVNLEYLLIGLYIVGAAALWTIRAKIRGSILNDLYRYVLFTIFSEITLSVYHVMYDTFNLLGHLYKVIAFYFLFRAVCKAGLVRYFFTLSEMGKMSAELLQETIPIEDILDIQMTKLRKLIPSAEQILVHFTCGPNCQYTAYSWGKLSELFPVGEQVRLTGAIKELRNQIRIIDQPFMLLKNIKEDGYDAAVSVMLKSCQEVMYIPLVNKNTFLGAIQLFIFHSAVHFTTEDIERASVFQQFATLSITQAQHQETVSKLSYEDSLTELPNRRFFFEELNKVHYDAKEYGTPFTLVYIDMNNLKYMNDTFGHEAGDKALYTIGQTMKSAIRQSDVPARLGGDEFAILFRHMALEEGLQTIDNLRQVFTSLTLADYSHSFAAAVGGASFPDETANIEELIKLADDRMYEHKRKLKEAIIK